jgi:nucleotide-binding universal stress UspA family protein
MVTKILLPHDGTEMSNKALARAIEFAKAFNSEIVLLHVIEDIPVPPMLILGNDRVLISRAKRSIAAELKKGWSKTSEEKIIANLVPKDLKTRVRSEAVVGSPAEEIIKFARTNKIDMIIVGSRRLGSISKIKALGSVARKVSEAAECPVLIVH